MKVLVDTSVWSLALRRKETSAVAEKLADLIRASMAVLVGPVRQELLSGISDEKTFLRLKSKLEYFDNPPITALDYETAARFYNICRSHGIQGSHIDFLICAVAANNELLIFTTDQDFERYQAHHKYMSLHSSDYWDLLLPRQAFQARLSALFLP